MTEKDYEAYVNEDWILYYDSPQQLYDYEGNVPFVEVIIFDINNN